MNEPNNPNAASAQWNPPGGDFNLDDLFPNPEGNPQSEPQVTQAPAQPVEPEYFLRVPTGSVYKTAEEAANGFAEKDRTIERQKQELAQLKARPHAQNGQQPAQPDFAETAFDRLAEAAQKGDKRGYIQALADVQMATLSPLAPLIEEVAQERAVRNLGPNADNFRTFFASEEYGKILEHLPTLKQAIEAAKVNPAQFANQLPELYELAYNTYVAKNTNQITRNAVNNNAQPVAPTPPRPTLSSSTPTPVPSGNPSPVSYTREQLLANRAARQQYLQRFRDERGGSLDVEFGKLGL